MRASRVGEVIGEAMLDLVRQGADASSVDFEMSTTWPNHALQRTGGSVSGREIFGVLDALRDSRRSLSLDR